MIHSILTDVPEYSSYCLLSFFPCCVVSFILRFWVCCFEGACFAWKSSSRNICLKDDIDDCHPILSEAGPSVCVCPCVCPCVRSHVPAGCAPRPQGAKHPIRGNIFGPQNLLMCQMWILSWRVEELSLEVSVSMIMLTSAPTHKPSYRDGINVR